MKFRLSFAKDYDGKPIRDWRGTYVRAAYYVTGTTAQGHSFSKLILVPQPR